MMNVDLREHSLFSAHDIVGITVVNDVFMMACEVSEKESLLKDVKYFLVELYYNKDISRDFKNYIFKNIIKSESDFIEVSSKLPKYYSLIFQECIFLAKKECGIMMKV